MLLGCLQCIFNYRKKLEQKNKMDACYYERAKFLPFYL